MDDGEGGRDPLVIELPVRCEHRELARGYVDERLGRQRPRLVVVDARHAVVIRPSFLDELVKAILVQRELPRLRFTAVTERHVRMLEAAGARRGVADRIQFRDVAKPKTGRR